MKLEIETILKKYDVSQAQIIVNQGDKEIFSLCYGEVCGEKITLNHKFRIASMSKMVIAVLVLKMVEEGVVELEEDISTYLGFKLRNPYYLEEKITLKHLLSHSSSISDSGIYSSIIDYTLSEPDFSKFKNTSLEALFNHNVLALQENFYKESPGTTFRYSNFGVGVMATAVEYVTGKLLGELVKEYICDPLGIDGNFDTSKIRENSLILPLIRHLGEDKRITRDGDRAKIIAHENREVGRALYSEPAGGFRVSGGDFNKFLEMLAKSGEYQGTRVLSNSSLALMREPIELDYPKEAYFDRSGLGLHITENIMEGSVFGHTGDAYGFVGMAFYSTQKGYSFLMFINGGILRADSPYLYTVEREIVDKISILIKNHN